jgi:hypothetical protein
VIHEERETALPAARVSDGDLWLQGADIERATGWSWKPEGLCRDAICVPLPARRAGELVRDGALNLSAMWRASGQPVVHDEAAATWVLGTGAVHRGEALASLQAPDFELPDLEGVKHRLSDYRGKRVFLVSWASW